MKHIYLALFCLLLTQILSGQKTFWNETEENIASLENTEESTVFPASKRAFSIDFNGISNLLATKAPVEFSGRKGLEITLPLPDGSDHHFKMFYSPSVEPGFQEKYPEIRSYRGFGVEDPTEIVRMTISPLGIKASILTADGEVYIDPFIEGQTRMHASYFVKDFDPHLLHEAMPACGSEDVFETSPLEGLNIENGQGELSLRSAGEPINLRTFRAAIAATGEWSLAEGGKDNAVAKIVACIDRGNQIFENELGFRLLLVTNNDQVVFDNPSTDPYPGSEPKSGRQLIGQNTSVLNLRLGQQAYDIGHIFTNRCSDVGGVASLASVCGGNKGSGTTCWYNRNLDYTVVRIMCHEMGHQFAAPHTFNNCGGNESFVTGYEPGSGSTIMSYGGLCGSNNVVSGATAARDITYYHANSLMNMYTFSRSLNCASEVPTNNSRPDAVMDYEDGFFIPLSTPFYLEGEGIDMEGDNVSYCFEQLDFGSGSCPLGQPTGTCPLFRSFPPNNNDYRVLPEFSLIWSNQMASSVNEVLPDYSREINFVLTVRDNNPEVGAWGMDTVTFNATEEAGPFIVTYPNGGEDQIAGDYVEIKWDVANTNVGPVNCKTVDILLQLNSQWGNTEVLKSSTANDGSEWVYIPEETRNNVRVMVRAADNIFFDISDINLDIVEPSSPGYSVGVSPNSGRVCLPDVFTTEILTSAYGGYSGTLELDVIAGLPVGATYSFGSSNVEASESTTLEIDLSDVTDRNDFVATVQIISNNGDTLLRDISLDVVSNDYSLLTTDYPADGVQGIEQSPTLEWPAIIDADYYNVQLASNPSFDASSIIEEWIGLTTQSIKVTDLLEKNSIYYWRVRGVNVCGPGPYTAPAAFSTEAASCAVYEAPDRGLKIPKGTVSDFELNIFQNADINDVNISHFDFFCDFLQDCSVSIVSPSGTEVVLMDQRCGNTTTALCKFDDDAPTGLKCPPLNRKAYRPEGKLSDFNGESAAGKWLLKVDVLQRAVSAELGGWELEICSNTILEAPVLIVNDTLKTKPSEHNPISALLLLCEDNNNSDDELEYTLSTTPSMGDITLNGSPLSAGATFTQTDINSGRVKYNNTAGAEGMDSFLFTVNDGEGGWTGTHQFDIELDEDFASSVNDFSQEAFFKVYPNPNNGRFTILLNEAAQELAEIQITDMNGRLIETGIISPGKQGRSFNIDELSEGVYFIRVINNGVQFTEKMIRHRD